MHWSWLAQNSGFTSVNRLFCFFPNELDMAGSGQSLALDQLIDQNCIGINQTTVTGCMPDEVELAALCFRVQVDTLLAVGKRLGLGGEAAIATIAVGTTATSTSESAEAGLFLGASCLA